MMMMGMIFGGKFCDFEDISSNCWSRTLCKQKSSSCAGDPFVLVGLY